MLRSPRAHPEAPSASPEPTLLTLPPHLRQEGTEAQEAQQGGEAARLILRIDENGEFQQVSTEGTAAQAAQAGGEAARLILRIDENGEFQQVGDAEARAHRLQLREATARWLQGLPELAPAAEDISLATDANANANAEAEAEAGGAAGGKGAAGLGLAVLLAAVGWVAAVLAGVGSIRGTGRSCSAHNAPSPYKVA